MVWLMHQAADNMLLTIAIAQLMGRQIIFKWSYLMVFMRVLVAVSVRWCKVLLLRNKNGYAWSS